VSTIEAALATIVEHGKRAGVNAFSEPLARRYMTAGASFVLVGADVHCWPVVPKNCREYRSR